MNYLSGPNFNAQNMCAALCLQHKVNEILDNHMKGYNQIKTPKGPKPQHINFI